MTTKLLDCHQGFTELLNSLALEQMKTSIFLTNICFIASQQMIPLPSPEACAVTGITPQLCEKKGLIEHEFIKKINKEFSLFLILV